MTHKKSNFLNEIKKHAIYVIQSPFDNNVYLGHCGAAYLKNTYSKLFNLHHLPTASLFEKAKKLDLPVHMFLLQEVECSTRKLFRHTICWATHLLENGYELGMSKSLIPYAGDFTKETAEIYESIKAQSLIELMDPSKSLFPNYKKAYKEHSDTIPTQIKFRVTQPEYKRIAQMAKDENLSLSRFCKLKALRNKTVSIDVMPIWEICKEYTEIEYLWKEVLSAIYRTRSSYPCDLAIMQDSINKITNLHSDLLKEFVKILNEIKKA